MVDLFDYPSCTADTAIGTVSRRIGSATTAFFHTVEMVFRADLKLKPREDLVLLLLIVHSTQLSSQPVAPRSRAKFYFVR